MGLVSRLFRCHETIDHPFVVVEQVLAADPIPILMRATDSASIGATPGASLHVDVGPIDVGATIAIELLDIDRRAPPEPNPRTTFGLRWRAVTASSVFPEMDADLLVYPFSEGETQLDLVCRYWPPLGILGEAIDRLALHGFAKASVGRFLREVAAHLRAVLRVPQPVPGLDAGS